MLPCIPRKCCMAVMMRLCRLHLQCFTLFFQSWLCVCVCVCIYWAWLPALSLSFFHTPTSSPCKESSQLPQQVSAVTNPSSPSKTLLYCLVCCSVPRRRPARVIVLSVSLWGMNLEHREKLQFTTVCQLSLGLLLIICLIDLLCFIFFVFLLCSFGFWRNPLNNELILKLHKSKSVFSMLVLHWQLTTTSEFAGFRCCHFSGCRRG